MVTIQTGAESADDAAFRQLALSKVDFEKAISAASDAVILTDSLVAEHCLPLLIKHIPACGRLPVLSIPQGEENKSLSRLEEIVLFLANRNIDRAGLLICLGGGMITDIGGFAASVYKRGIKCIHVPTSLLGMVDASWGGKNGVDLNSAKNLLGTFQMNTPVFVHAEFLNSLPSIRMKEGLSEMIKHEILFSDEFPRSADLLQVSDYSGSADLILKHARWKMNIVGQDPHEKGIRKILNFGHTLGHALESCAIKNGQPANHGICVAAGMIYALFLSVEQAGYPADQANAIASYIRETCFSNPVLLPDWNELFPFLLKDKKNSKAGISWVLLNHTKKPVFDIVIDEQHLFRLYGNSSFRGFLQ
jgi:3-dehydroquinate synthase